MCWYLSQVCLLYFQKERVRSGELLIQGGWKNYNFATGRYEIVPNKKKPIKIRRDSTIADITERIASAYFPSGLSEEKTEDLSSLDYYIAKNDGLDLPDEIEGLPFTFDRWRQLPDIKAPIRLYLYTKVSETNTLTFLFVLWKKFAWSFKWVYFWYSRTLCISRCNVKCFYTWYRPYTN